MYTFALKLKNTITVITNFLLSAFETVLMKHKPEFSHIPSGLTQT